MLPKDKPDPESLKEQAKLPGPVTYHPPTGNDADRELIKVIPAAKQGNALARARGEDPEKKK